jgi:predicted CXXCH cytochrome family protein
MRRSTFGVALRAVTAVGLLGTAACDDDIRFVDREPFNPPPDAVAGLLGYYDAADGFTTCGNCHADEQASWAETAHAGAWETLQASGGAQAFCEGCHAISENGNVLEGSVGYDALTAASVADSAILAVYHDVQCESCHGPGNDHALSPSAVMPLASAAVGTGLTNGCGECHEGAHHPFVEQWEASAHGTGGSFTYAGGISSCNQCHSAQGALVEQFSEDVEYLEKGGAPLPITCIVCHDPHSDTYDAQLRAPLSGFLTNNLCIKCHNRRTVPSDGFRGPHAAQGPLVLGQAIGWWPPGFAWLEGLTGSHGDPAVNPRLCGTCHVERFEITDPATGDFVFQSVGHLFEAIPCVDVDGIPVGGACTNDQRRFDACAACHGTAAASRAIFESFQGELDLLLRQIWVDSDANGILDATDTGILAQIVASVGGKELDRTDTLFTFAEGLLYNAQVAATHTEDQVLDGRVVVAPGDTASFSGHFASGNGVHNPPFLEALLKASIQGAADFYGIVLPAELDLTLPALAEARRP